VKGWGGGESCGPGDGWFVEGDLGQRRTWGRVLVYDGLDRIKVELVFDEGLIVSSSGWNRYSSSSSRIAPFRPSILRSRH
jgi:hypothetical protein